MINFALGFLLGVAVMFLVGRMLRPWATKRFLRRYEEKSRLERAEKDQWSEERALDKATLRAERNRRRNARKRLTNRRKK